jgi:cobalt-zinc-cadmium efflux system protein
VIAGGAAISVTGSYWIDPALSFAIGALILWSAIGIVRETLNILLEGMPRGMELEKIDEAISAVQGVLGVHDLHVWSLGSESHALSCHILIADVPLSASDLILQQVNAKLQEVFHIDHTTIQFEHVVCDVAHGCVQPVSAAHHHPD